MIGFNPLRPRAAIFGAVRPWLGKGGLTPARIREMNRVLDLAGVPDDRDDRPAPAPQAGPFPAAVSPGLRPSLRCVEIVQKFEGCARERRDGRFEAYPDPASGGDPWTIGWGSTGPDVRPGTIWDQKQCDDRFVAHLGEFAGKVAKLLGDAPTTQSQFDALVSFAYNLGPGNLASSTLLRRHKAGDFAAAAAEFAKWNKANKKVMAGLTRRRSAEAALYLEAGGP
ncbi:MAG: lysozyme [Sphingomonadales bacterium]|nr:lysozyme [Sphingomonadales bacterium]